MSLPFSVSDGSGAITWPYIRDFAKHAEDAGLDSVWVCDHFISEPPGRPPEGILEGWTVLAALAVATSRVELGQLVMCTAFRNPGLLAKMAVTADAVSGGRITLGLGAGWSALEYGAFGFPADHRASRFEEALRIIARLLDGETVTMAGRFHAAREAVLLPPPQRRIPVLVAAKGKRMLSLTAQYAQAWNTAWYTFPDDALRQQLSAMAVALAAADRDPASLRRTVGLFVEDQTPNDVARALDACERLDIDDVIVGLIPRNRAALDTLVAAVHRRHS